MAFARTTAALVLLAGLACSAQGQTYLNLAATPDGDARPCATMLSDGGRALAHGRADPLTGSTDFQVTRYNATGAAVWSTRIGSGFSETPTAVLELPSGDLVVVGSTFPFGAGGRTILVAKLTPTGALAWANQYVGDHINGPGAAVNTDGEIVITSGYESGFPKQIGQVLKIDSNGNQIFNLGFQMLKDSLDESIELTDVVVTGGGLIVAAGSFSRLQGSSFVTDPFVLTVRTDGTFEQAKVLPGLSTPADGDQREVFTGIRALPDGNFHAMGDLDDLFTSEGRVFHVELSADFDPVNAWTIGLFGGSIYTAPRSLDVDAQGNLVATGSRAVGDGNLRMWMWSVFPSGVTRWRTGIALVDGYFEQGGDIVATTDSSGAPAYWAVGSRVADLSDPGDLLSARLDATGRINCSDEDLFGFAGGAAFSSSAIQPERVIALGSPVTWTVSVSTVSLAETEICSTNPCPADFDGSGFVDSDDFVFFIDQFTRGCTGPGVGALGPDPLCFKSADFDDTGFVDSDDFVAFIDAFSQGC
ncbi:MAG: hypothetical protein SFY95_07615 [Planctomycetota bacterium]|nr:hypothetical protein [Planctomycetota bacterium]